jgi:hypothetical protein
MQFIISRCHTQTAADAIADGNTALKVQDGFRMARSSDHAINPITSKYLCHAASQQRQQFGSIAATMPIYRPSSHA